MVKWREIDTYAKKWIKEAGEQVLDSFEQTLDIQTKSNPNDFVTNIDKATEEFFVTRIKERFPDHRILGEEGLGDRLDELDGVVWIIDPIDGTTNFIQQQRNFAISIGIYEHGVGKVGLIYDVIPGELYHCLKGEGAFLNDKPLMNLEKVRVEEAIIGLNATWLVENSKIDPKILRALVQDARGTRSYGSAAIEIANVAAGRLDAYMNLRLSPWDFAAGIILIEEVGGVAKTLRGEPLNLLKQNSVFISKPGLFETVLKDYLRDGKW